MYRCEKWPSVKPLINFRVHVHDVFQSLISKKLLYTLKTSLWFFFSVQYMLIFGSVGYEKDPNKFGCPEPEPGKNDSRPSTKIYK
jgi:hypothetical protein